ncbi:MAG: hypothetical protein A2648_03010 [Candidatus Lloydbacteria bacterium RIFCSPHIGHO2_01_FULL_41_20]|uniref:Uncharacterized protein n=1 Tax=Candidatus Lloydbacteria bacterium RIFCSPHIGHO2_01_FULL_41_20 TaxID=1798657 RepID=A0A1G2CRU5_9BACT|nr:MAG: hypothetical protein A2648_03010 [Candidatus Lloydbacteria bacterium RIFCSPHIGHO2_01_FULL_41_20]
MLRHIENLRKKPKHIRKGILYISAPLITLIIVSLWFFSGNIGENKIPTATERASVQEIAPRELFSQDLLKIFSGISLSGMIGGIKSAVGGLFVEEYKQKESIQ